VDGLLRLSRVVFNVDSTRAALRMSFQSLQGGGMAFYLILARLPGRAWALWGDVGATQM
jgi:hypothetical protein